ncbi:hypothetical protein SAMN05443248_8370 [Bradyrhizobium erythrophlei]|uniref:Uncharacterized protein n=1 Tax=Bradyrhizobium erythrophlei TaxID=1437360 RepID=A0A1M5YIN2_9BRAD|nr:hypothetical protein SAMN05443248_8370 [Bradyrhizobium erythrophlei]
MEAEGVNEEYDPELDLLKQCRLGPEFEPDAARRIDSMIDKKRRQRFVMFPQQWIERLSGARHIATYRVALRVLQRHGQCRGRPFPLPNNIEGVNRWAKSMALSELEQLGLIRVERRVRKSPLVAVVAPS